jgi:predicted transcriptional regulator
VARPKSQELTDRELEVMHAFWNGGPATADQARARLAGSGTDLAYVTVANVVRQLEEKGFLSRENEQRPFVYAAQRSFDDVSSRLVGHLLKKVFDGSRKQLLVQVLGQQKLTAAERAFLRQILDAQQDSK